MKGMLRFLAIFGIVFYIFRTFLKLFGSTNLNNAPARKQTESGDGTINVDFAPKQKSKVNVQGDYVDYEEVSE